MAVYERDLTRIQKIITQVYDILEPFLNKPLNRKIVTFLFRHLKFGKVTRYLEVDDLMLGG